MLKRSTLAEMASQYNRTPKTFSKYVKQYGIPFEPLGRSMMFDPIAVSNHLTARRLSLQPSGKSVTTRRKQAKGGSRFAEAVGI